MALPDRVLHIALNTIVSAPATAQQGFAFRGEIRVLRIPQVAGHKIGLTAQCPLVFRVRLADYKLEVIVRVDVLGVLRKFG